MTKQSIPFRLTPEGVELCRMLKYRRPAGSITERAFIDRWITPLGAQPDKAGNQILRIPEPDGTPSPILWSAHTDTVHRYGGKHSLSWINPTTVTSSKNHCLGADDTVGCWLLCQMAKAGIPGLYIWHAEEEVGGRGSSALAYDTPEVLEGIKYAIAFDRRGTREIITHQLGERCASDAFARSLADALGLPLSPSDKGMYTDTANYTSLVPECTNVSVGYEGEHTSHECLDVAYAQALLAALLAADFSELVCARNPEAQIVSPWKIEDDESWGLRTPRKRPTIAQFADRELEDYVRGNPEDVADFLYNQGFSAGDIACWIDSIDSSNGWNNELDDEYIYKVGEDS